MATDAASLVTEFLSSAGSTTEENVAAFEKYLAADVVWDTGSRVLRSREECVAHARHIPEEYGVAAFSARVLHIAGNENVALTERIDDIMDLEGGVLMGARVMGVFEVEAGQITAWRDYYDTAALGAELAEAKAKAKGSA